MKSDVRHEAEITELRKWHDRERDKELIAQGGEQTKDHYWKIVTAICSGILAVISTVGYLIYQIFFKGSE